MGVEKEAGMVRHRLSEVLIALAAAAVVAGAIGGLALLLADSDEAPPPGSPPPIAAPETADTPPPVVTTPPPATTEVTPDGGEPGFEPGEGAPLPPMGIPTAAFDWETAVLPLGAGEGWLHQLLTVDGELWAVVATPEGPGEHTVVFASRDGLQWQQRDFPAAVDGDGPAQLWVTEDEVVAMVAGWGEQGDWLEVWVLPDGGTWQRADLSGIASDDAHTWLSGVAGGDGVLVAVGAAQPLQDDSYPPAVVIERDGFVVEIDEATASYVITDAATGAVVSHGNLDRMWPPYDEEGVVIYDPATYEPVFRTRWDVLEAAATAAYEDARFGERLVVEVATEELVLRLDEFTGVLTVADTSGDEVFRGTEEDLWRGPPPTFTDPRSGEVILVVPWDEWEEAFQAIYEDEQGSGPTPLLMRSTDRGATWTPIDAAPDPGDGFFYFIDVVRVPDGFLALGAVEPGMGDEATPPQPIMMHSPDGLSWSALPGDGLPGWMHQMRSAGEIYFALLTNEAGAAVVTSADARSWQVLLRDDDLALPLGSAWFDHVADGPLGTFVAGMWNGWVEAEVEPVEIAKRGRTLTITGPVYTVTDDATGEVLATFDESVTWHGEHQEWVAESGFRWSQGGLALFADDGTVAFAVSHREMERAMEGRWAEPDAAYRSEQFVAWSDGAGWKRVALPEDLGPHAWCAGMVVLEDRVVIATHVDTFYGEGEVETELRMLVGRPTEGT